MFSFLDQYSIFCWFDPLAKDSLCNWNVVVASSLSVYSTPGHIVNYSKSICSIYIGILSHICTLTNCLLVYLWHLGTYFVSDRYLVMTCKINVCCLLSHMYTNVGLYVHNSSCAVGLCAQFGSHICSWAIW